MKKVTAFVGSAHKRNTHQAVVQFLNNLQALGEVEYEIVTLSDYRLGVCRGCRVCFEKGEQFCPLRDDRDLLMDKIVASDGVVFATPNYSFQMSGMMKMFLDRFGFAIHRPRYFGKAFTSIVTQGVGGGDKIIENLDFVALTLGFNTVKGSCVTAFDPRTEEEQQKIDKALARHARLFHTELANPVFPVPTLFRLMGFRMSRTTMRQKLDDRSLDYRYYTAKGWFKSDYYYPVRLGPIKKVAGKLFDAMAPTIMRMIA